MIRYLMAGVAIVLCLPTLRAAEPALTENYWRLSIVSPLGTETQQLALLKFEKKDGKLDTSVALDGIKASITAGEAKVDAKSVSVPIGIGGGKYTFEGNIDPKNDTQIRGSLSDGNRTFRVLLSSQKSDAMEAGAKLPKAPEPMTEAQKLNAAVSQLSLQMRRSKDVNDKAELQDKMKAAQKTADEKVPGLLREVVAKHAESPFAVQAATLLIANAGKYKAKANEVATWAKIVQEDAKQYGAKIATDAAVQAGESLISQKDAAAFAMPIAKQLVDGLKDTDPLAVQSKALTLLSKANKAAGKMDSAVEARLTKIEKALDDEYVKKVPPFKPEKYAGRQNKEAKRVAVMELFTGAQCPPCVAADVAFDALEMAYKPSDLVLIQYHMHIPGPDPLTNPDSVARFDFYREKFPMNMRGTPSTLFNGKPAAGGGGGMANAEKKFGEYSKLIDNILEEKSEISIGGSAKLDGNKVGINVDVAGVAEPGKNVKLRLVVVEEKIKYIGGNNLRFHHQVVRSIPEAASITEKSMNKTVSVDLDEVKKGLTKYLDEFASTRPFPNSNRPMDLKHLKVIALVQNDETGEILNAAQFDVK